MELDEILKNATFLCIDGEFTGLNSGPDAGVFDTPAQYYAKLRTGSMDFLLIQFGLSVFTFNQEIQKCEISIFNKNFKINYKIILLILIFFFLKV